MVRLGFVGSSVRVLVPFGMILPVYVASFHHDYVAFLNHDYGCVCVCLCVNACVCVCVCVYVCCAYISILKITKI